MNHTITDTAPAYIVERFTEHGRESLLQKITGRLISALKGQRRHTVAQFRAQTFIEESVLDPNVGPEIERALR